MPIDPSTAFVSYSREDLEFALRLAKDLKAKGAKVWMDKLDLRAGQLWDAEVETAVDQCSRMLVILSPAAAASQKVKNEFMAAMDEGKEVIPVYFRDCKVPLQLRRFQYADFRSDHSVGLEELLASLGYTQAPTPNEVEAAVTSVPQLSVTKNETAKPPNLTASRFGQPRKKPAKAASPQFTDPKMARLYRQAQAGDSDAMVNLAFAYYQGKGVTKDFKQAVLWYRKGAEAGDAAGMYNMGVMYRDGTGVTQDYSQALHWFRQAADLGDADAMKGLALMYQEGLGVTQDYSQALHWFRQAADLDDADAMIGLGLMYDKGLGVAQDYVQAAAWDRKAAEAGDPVGMNNLGVDYRDGLGVDPDPGQAVAWFRKAANAGSPEAMCSLGWAYEDGNGVQPDHQQALICYRKAARLGDKKAKENVKRLGEKP